MRRGPTSILVIVTALLVASALPVFASGNVPVTIELTIDNRAELDTLTRLVSIDDVRGLRVRAAAMPRQLRALRAAGYRWHVVPAAAKADGVIMCPDGWENDPGRTWDCYPTYDQYTDLMTLFTEQWPDLCRLVDLGAGSNTTTPHQLLALVVSDNPGFDEDEPEVLLTSSIHGDETTGFILTLRLIDHLLSNHGTNTEIAHLIDETEIWINPLANPDGTYYGGNHTVGDAIRNYTYANGANSDVDGNRNFPDPRGDDHPDNRSWWTETQVMMALAEAKTFVLSANFHGGVEVVNYPWDTWERRHPDDTWFQALSRSWADLAQSDSPGGYMTDFENGITNGYDWYQVFGGRQDFMTFFHGGREVTIEMSTTKLVPSSALDDYWNWNRRALLDFITHAHEGIRGLVTDSDGNPLAATIEVVGVDTVADGSMVHTDPAAGDYHRLLLPGLYDLKIHAPGFFTEAVEGVTVVDGPATVINAVLHRDLVRQAGRRVRP